MALTSTCAAFDYAGLPVASYRAGENVLVAGSKTGRLLFLKDGAVAVVRQGTEIATIDTPGAVFGEISALLNTPHTADVYALRATQFYVADADLLRFSAAALSYVAAALARRLDRANEVLVASLETRESPTQVCRGPQ
jgi:CRP/FNR family transcriptional regulator, cyclic AMP receptor protein